MTPITVAYLAYLASSVFITIWVGNTLHRHGRPFLIDVFCGTERQADAVNNLLLVGFYLTNVALVLFLLQSRTPVRNNIDAVHLLSDKLGVVLTLLGVMHFTNVFILIRVRHHIHHHRTTHV